jgi:5-methylcytosine-specific restriction endonuclease McrA
VEIRKVPISQVEPWDKNPRGIKTKDFDRLKKQILICEQCGVEFSRYRGNIKCQHNYCSQKCHGLSRRGRRISPETEFKPGQVARNKGMGMTPEQKKERRREVCRRFNNKPERKAYMKNYDIRFGRYSIDAAYWHWLCEQLDNRCQYCGHQFPARKLEIDHIIPVSKGGTSSRENIQPLCRSCNSKKRDAYFMISNAVASAQKEWAAHA